MWNRQELKMRGKMAFKRNYGAAVAVALLMGIISLIFGGGNVTERLQYSDTVEYSGSASQNVIEDFLSSPKGMLFAGIATSIVLVMALVGMVLQYLVENHSKVHHVCYNDRRWITFLRIEPDRKTGSRDDARSVQIRTLRQRCTDYVS